MKNKIPHKLIQKAETVGGESLIIGRSLRKSQVSLIGILISYK